MANKEKKNKYASHLKFEAAGHKVTNIHTGAVNWFAPIVLEDKWTGYRVDALTLEAMYVYSEQHNLEIKWTRLGSHEVKALMVPCKKTIQDANGKETFADSTADEQHQLYCSICSEDWYTQYKDKKESRCQIRGKDGKLKYCPTHIKNPAYDPNGPKDCKKNPKKIANSCDNCEFKDYRPYHQTINFSDHKSDKELDFGENQSALPSANATSYATDAEKLFHYIISRSSKVAAVTDKILDSPTDAKISEMARELGIPRSTFWSQLEKIREMAKDFWLEEYGHLPNIA